MAASFNRTFVLGNLGADPELHYTKEQTPVVTMSVATKSVSGQGPDRKEYVEWHRVVLWAKQAENAAKYLKKGSAVFVEGRLQTRSWEDNGIKKYSTEIVANDVQYLSSPQGQSAHQQQGAAQTVPGTGHVSAPAYPNTPDNDQVPF